MHWLQAYAAHIGHLLGRYGGGGLFLINVLADRDTTGHAADMGVSRLHSTVDHGHAYALPATPRKRLVLTHARAISVAIFPSLS